MAVFKSGFAHGFRVAIVGDLKPRAPSPVAVPFVILARDGKADQMFPTLKDAVERAQSGDTIEIRSDGPFLTGPIALREKKMTIRAGEGYRPVISLDAAFLEANEALITSDSVLVLEGLDLRSDSKAPGGHLIHVQGLSLVVQNCRLLTTGKGLTVQAWDSPSVALRNSCLIGALIPLNWVPSSRGKLVIDRSVLCGEVGAGLGMLKPPDGLSVLLRDSTLVGTEYGLKGEGVPAALAKPESKTLPELQLETSGCIIYGRKSILVVNSDLRSTEGERLRFLGMWRWKGGENLLSPTGPFLHWPWDRPYPEGKPVRFPEDWKAFWKSDFIPGIAGEPIFEGGDVCARLKEDSLNLQPTAFRLTKDSPGKGKGEGGQDLGADVEKVGPGKPYEDWKKTPEYEAWQKKVREMMAGK
jgi:hypothetical protein